MHHLHNYCLLLLHKINNITTPNQCYIQSNQMYRTVWKFDGYYNWRLLWFYPNFPATFSCTQHSNQWLHAHLCNCMHIQHTSYTIRKSAQINACHNVYKICNLVVLWHLLTVIRQKNQRHHNRAGNHKHLLALVEDTKHWFAASPPHLHS